VHTTPASAPRSLLLEDALRRHDEDHHDEGDEDSRAAAPEEEGRVISGSRGGIRRELDGGRGELENAPPPPVM